jgi:hypothetical protein
MVLFKNDVSFIAIELTPPPLAPEGGLPGEIQPSGCRFCCRQNPHPLSRPSAKAEGHPPPLRGEGGARVLFAPLRPTPPLHASLRRAARKQLLRETCPYGRRHGAPRAHPSTALSQSERAPRDQVRGQALLPAAFARSFGGQSRERVGFGARHASPLPDPPPQGGRGWRVRQAPVP